MAEWSIGANLGLFGSSALLRPQRFRASSNIVGTLYGMLEMSSAMKLITYLIKLNVFNMLCCRIETGPSIGTMLAPIVQHEEHRFKA